MREALFLERILASATHEMQNIMAIIKESGALADDILNANGRPHLRHGDLLESALSAIREQVERGHGLMLALNGFAHACAEYPRNSDLSRLARQICALVGRMARLKGCSLNSPPEGPPLLVRGSGMLVMRSIYGALASALDMCGPGSTIRVGVSGMEGEYAAVLRIALADGAIRPAGENAPDHEELKALMAAIGGDSRAGGDFLELLYAPALAPEPGPQHPREKRASGVSAPEADQP